MTIAVYLPDSTPYSMKFCAWNIMEILQEKYAVHFIEIKSLDELPMANADIYWDPRCGGGIAPALKFKALNKPLVLTVHGMAMFTLPLDTFYFSFSDKIVCPDTTCHKEIGAVILLSRNVPGYVLSISSLKFRGTHEKITEIYKKWSLYRGTITPL